ncbi:MAG: ISAs1 family transposase [Lewinella sp.]|uniref:ISAs1 family transposase n=1 Tax=Lewinella sp. TaxID=2004506 RepID=UPI003D6A6D0E
MKKRTETTDTNPFMGLFEQVHDYRCPDHITYPLEEILFLLVTATLSGSDELTMTSVFGEDKLPWLRKYYAYKNGVPSHDTLGRVLSNIDRREFEGLFVNWVAAHFKISPKSLLHFDGKRINSSADKLDQSKKRSEGGKYADIIVNVYASAAGITLAQNNVSDKMDEIRGALELLDWLDLSGCCITGDANFCRTAIIEKIIARKADYILALKLNWPKQYADAQTLFDDQDIEKQCWVTEETGHGRYEKRSYRSIGKESFPPSMIDQFAGIAQLVEVNRTRIVQRKDKVENDTHYYITSLDEPIDQLAHKIRRHWSIENELHYVLDVAFNEDASRIRNGHSASNQSLIRKIALNMLRVSKQKGSIKTQRMKCAISDIHREKILSFSAMR